MSTNLRGRLAVSLLILTAATGSMLAQGQSGQAPGQNSDEINSKISVHARNPQDAATPTKGGTGVMSPAITGHGGPVMAGTPVAYLIWYGNWNQNNGSDTPAKQQLVRDFLSGIGDSPYFKINSTYTGVPGPVTGSVTLKEETTEPGSPGNKPVSDNDIRAAVTNAISSGRLPLNKDGVYFVLTSSNISKSGFCTQYCGWHTYAKVNGVPVKYSFVGNANRCLNACAAQTISPNINAGVDRMLSVVAHELEEAVTDPELNAWYDSRGAENADKCAWTFGQNLPQTSTGAYYNMTLQTQSGSTTTSPTTRNYLIQRNLSAIDSKCYVNWATQAQ